MKKLGTMNDTVETTEENTENELDDDKRQFELAQEEWRQVRTVVPIAVDESSAVPEKREQDVEIITYDEAFRLLKLEDYEEFMPMIKPVTPARGFQAIWYFLRGHKNLNSQLIPERNLVFAIAASPFEPGNKVHQRVLTTIYKTFTGEFEGECALIGSHWEKIGFQGSNPATDLRGVGFWSLLNLLYFITSAHLQSRAMDMFALSHHETQHFPFAVLSINATAIALNVLRKGFLNSVCNARGEVALVTNEMYAGIMLLIFQRWKNENKTIKESGYLLKEVEQAVKRNVTELLRLQLKE